jgi:hypothetical protein
LYVAAFGGAAKDAFRQIEGGYIRVLNAFRNVLAHKRGCADLKFLEEIQSFSEFNHIKEHELILLDGQAVKKMRDSAMKLGQKLIQIADTALLA